MPGFWFNWLSSHEQSDHMLHHQIRSCSSISSVLLTHGISCAFRVVLGYYTNVCVLPGVTHHPLGRSRGESVLQRACLAPCLKATLFVWNPCKLPQAAGSSCPDATLTCPSFLISHFSFSATAGREGCQCGGTARLRSSALLGASSLPHRMQLAECGGHKTEYLYLMISCHFFFHINNIKSVPFRGSTLIAHI